MKNPCHCYDACSVGVLTLRLDTDLSFNNIKRIEGIETLTKLTDLSLYNNAITTIEGLDNCKSLQCLSLGNNEIRSTESVREPSSAERCKACTNT